jgi:hypothetical protein
LERLGQKIILFTNEEVITAINDVIVKIFCLEGIMDTALLLQEKGPGVKE